MHTIVVSLIIAGMVLGPYTPPPLSVYTASSQVVQVTARVKHVYLPGIPTRRLSGILQNTGQYSGITAVWLRFWSRETRDEWFDVLIATRNVGGDPDHLIQVIGPVDSMAHFRHLDQELCGQPLRWEIQVDPAGVWFSTWMGDTQIHDRLFIAGDSVYTIDDLFLVCHWCDRWGPLYWRGKSYSEIFNIDFSRFERIIEPGEDGSKMGIQYITMIPEDTLWGRVRFEYKHFGAFLPLISR